jgi:hypothetical protein
MRRTSFLLAAASATLLLLSACSSSAKGSAATTTAKASDTTLSAPDTSATPTPLDTTAVTDTVSPTVVASGTHKDEPFCVAAVSFNNAPSPFNDSTATSDDFKKFFATVVTPGIAAMRASEPAAVKADVDTVANAFDQLGTVFAANNWDLQKTASDSQLAALLNGQAFADATTNLDKYCGFTG